MVTSVQTLSLQSFSDSNKNVLLVVAEKWFDPRFIIKSSNVVFPEIWKGDETEALDSIEKFIKEGGIILSGCTPKASNYYPKQLPF